MVDALPDAPDMQPTGLDADLRPQCGNALDDDDDGVIDLFDPGCAHPDDDDEVNLPQLPTCADGVDNDDDGLMDYPADPECAAAGGESEGAVCGADVSVASMGQDGGRVRLLLDTSGPPTAAECAEGVGRGAVVQVTLTEPSVVRAVVNGGPSPGTLMIHGRHRCRVRATEFGCAVGERSVEFETQVLPPGALFLHVQWVGADFAVDAVELDVFVSSIVRACNDGLDNDEDGLVDVSDPGCASDGDDDEGDPEVVPECADGLDNDGDGATDWPLDVDCGAAGAPREYNACPPRAHTVVAGVGRSRFRVELDGRQDGVTHGRCGGGGEEAIIVLDVSEPARLIFRLQTPRRGAVAAYLRAECQTSETEVFCDAAWTDRQFTVERVERGRYFLFLDHDLPFSDDLIGVDIEVNLEPLPLGPCEDGLDNDEDGRVDRADPGCGAAVDSDESDSPVEPQCADGQDNDADGLIDWPSDPDCQRAGGVMESPACGEEIELVHVPDGGGRFALQPARLSPGWARASCGGDLGGERIFALNLPSASTLEAYIEGPEGGAETRIFVRGDCRVPETEIACGERRISLNRVPPGPVFVFAELAGFLGDGQAPVMVIEAHPLIRACNDQLDNDDDGRVDLADPGCADSLGLDETDPAELPECADGLDNDDDGALDWPADEDCAGAGDVREDQPVCAGVAQVFELVDEGGRFMVDVENLPDLHRGQCGGGTGEAVVRLVLTSAAQVTIETQGEGFDTVLYARGNCGQDPAGELGCDDDGGDGQLSRLRLDLVPGTWFFFVDGFGGVGGRTEVLVDVVAQGEGP